MLDKDKVNSLRDLALDHLPDTKALSKKIYTEHRNGRAVLQAVAFAPTLLINSPLSTTVEKLAGKLLALVGKHPDTHIEYLIDDGIDSDALSISVQDAVLWAEQDRPYIEELLMESARKLCEISGAALPPWMASVDDKSEVIQNIEKPAPVGAVGPSSGMASDKDETGWSLKTSIQRYPGYRWPLYQFLKAAHMAGRPCPKARDVVDAWTLNPPPDVQAMPDGVKYNSGLGKKKEANLKAIQQAIEYLLNLHAGQAPPKSRTRRTRRTSAE